jgi:hypothetical protein
MQMPDPAWLALVLFSEKAEIRQMIPASNESERALAKERYFED